jgi:hypothetical protein
MSIRIRALQRLQHSLFQANILLSQRIHHLNFQLCAPEFSSAALREAVANAREATKDVRACLGAFADALDEDPANVEGTPQ